MLGCHERELKRLRRVTVGKISRKRSWRKPVRTPYKNKRKIKIEGRNKRKRLKEGKVLKTLELMTKEAREKSLKYSALDY